MAVIGNSDNIPGRICDALGLKRCKSLCIRMAVNDVVTVNATTIVDREQLDGVAEVLERGEYVLVERGRLRRLEIAAGEASHESP